MCLLLSRSGYRWIKGECNLHPPPSVHVISVASNYSQVADFDHQVLVLNKLYLVQIVRIPNVQNMFHYYLDSFHRKKHELYFRNLSRTPIPRRSIGRPIAYAWGIGQPIRAAESGLKVSMLHGLNYKRLMGTSRDELSQEAQADNKCLLTNRQWKLWLWSDVTPTQLMSFPR